MHPLKLKAPNPIDAARLAQLRETAGDGPVLILTHDNPDPDALASGKALATLLQQAWNVPSRLIYGGLVARAENLALLKRLTPEWEYADDITGLESYSAVALVDTQPGAGNNRLPETASPLMVFDHHQPQQAATRQAQYADLRPDIGAAVTLLYQHLQAARVEPDPVLATAMYYGLTVDTLNLSRGASPADEAVFIDLLARIDRSELIRIEQARRPRDYFRAIHQGLQAARLHGQAILARLGPLHRPDMTADIADLLIRVEGVEAALCLGQYGETLHLALRTKPFGLEAGTLIQQIVPEAGRGGGHGAIAGGQLPLGGRDASFAAAEVEQRFLAVMGAPSEGVPLLAE